MPIERLQASGKDVFPVVHPPSWYLSQPAATILLLSFSASGSWFSVPFSNVVLRLNLTAAPTLSGCSPTIKVLNIFVVFFALFIIFTAGTFAVLLSLPSRGVVAHVESAKDRLIFGKRVKRWPLYVCSLVEQCLPPWRKTVSKEPSEATVQVSLANSLA